MPPQIPWGSRFSRKMSLPCVSNSRVVFFSGTALRILGVGNSATRLLCKATQSLCTGHTPHFGLLRVQIVAPISIWA